jgi:predicted methyltransferase/DNA-directed RNA polymerase subunit RPC12/RpoP
MGADKSGQDTTASSLATVTESVAAAVRLQEGEAGVLRVLSTIHKLAPVPTREVSRQVGIPVPLVAAISNELRTRGVVSPNRPLQLTEYGRSLLDSGLGDGVETWCSCCGGQGLVLPPALREAAARVEALTERAPAVDMTIDQSHCTVETKFRRIALLLGLDLLPAPSMLMIGDDDLMSLSVVAAGAALGRPLVQRLAVVDISAELLDFIRGNLAELGGSAPPPRGVDLYRHDLRDPLPEPLRDRYDLAMTDPPYTAEGARLFLSRAVEGLRAGPGRAVAFSFGPKGPTEGLEVQRAVTGIGLTQQATYRNFNEYLGSGLLGGTSHLYWLSTTTATASTVPERYDGSLYTADLRAARTREYLCLDCRTRHPVGAGSRWASVAQLKEAGCPSCGGRRFRPLQLVTAEGEA